MIDRQYEEDLIRRVHAGILGDPQKRYQLTPAAAWAAGEITKMHRPLLMKWAHHYARRFQVELEDMMQVASIGLLHALVRFDFSKGVRLCTYAGHWVRHYAERMGQDSGGVVRVPVHMQASGRMRTVKALSLDEAPPGYSDTRGDMMHADCRTPEEEAVRNEVQSLARKAMDRVMPAFGSRNEQILNQRLCRHEHDQTTLASLGRQWGVGRERVRQVEEKLIAKLRGNSEIRRAARVAGLL